jgi:hypothetical protein
VQSLWCPLSLPGVDRYALGGGTDCCELARLFCFITACSPASLYGSHFLAWLSLGICFVCPEPAYYTQPLSFPSPTLCFSSYGAVPIVLQTSSLHSSTSEGRLSSRTDGNTDCSEPSSLPGQKSASGLPHSQ